MNRRSFLAASAALPLVAGAAPRPTVVDTHVHCFAGKDAKFPYHAKAPYSPEPTSSPEMLIKCMDASGVDFAVIVHPEPYQDDHRYLEHCLSIGKKRLKGTCLFFADDPTALKRMADLAKKVPLIAARVHAYAPDRLPPFGKPELRALWKQAGDLGLAVQLHFEPRYAPGFEPLIRELKDVRVIIDHLGRPFQGKPEEHAVVVKWSRYPNTVMKLSSVPEKKAYPHRDVQPIIKELTAAFGADRMIYGGGFGDGATGESYTAERERIRAFIAHLSDADRAKVMGGTAAKLFGFSA